MAATAIAPRCMTMDETAVYLGVTSRTLQYWHRRGEGPPSFPAGKRRLFVIRDVDAWVDAQRAAARAS